jgi:hypothetical protein
VGVISYAAELGNASAGNYLDAGRYTMSGPGGVDIGNFSGSITVAPELEWTNRAALEAITRSAGVTVTWTGGEPSTFVTIQGQSFVTQGTQVTGSSFQCWARNTDRQFTIPATVLLTMPASQTLTPAPGVTLLQRGSLALATVGRGTRVQASGLDYGTLGSQFGIAQSTQWR